MKFDKDSAVTRARQDLAGRLGVSEADIALVGSSSKEFPDMSLGAPADGEMSAQMISNGWAIELGHGGKSYEYRGDKYQLRLRNFKGKNYLVAG
jgi:hypothetical protein